MADLEIYTGFWRDYSVDGVGSGVLTLPISSAGYLISGLTLLVSLAGTALWVIVAYIWHQCAVATDASVNYHDLQLQVLLRNASTPFAAIVHAFKVFLAWRKSKTSRLLRLAAVAVTAGVLIAIVTVAGVFVGATVASHSEDDVVVLAKPGLCGEARQASLSTGDVGKYNATYTWQASKALRGRAYAKAWYSEDAFQSAAGSSAYPVRRLPYTKSRGPCPFPQVAQGRNRCRFSIDNSSDPNSAIVLDTGLLHSATHFGINGPTDHSLQFRRKATCMPFSATDLFQSPYVEDGNNYTALRAGSKAGPGNITLMYDRHTMYTKVGYMTGAVVYDPASSHVNGSWQPISLLARNDSIVSLYNILPNSVSYLDKSYDPLFAATGVNTGTLLNDAQPIFYGDWEITTLVCLDQVQWCNPLNGKCTAETYPVAAMEQAAFDIDLNAFQGALLWRFTLAVDDKDMFDSGIGNLGVSGLLAQEATFNNMLSTPLPSDQWIREVSLWFETSLATIQESVFAFVDVSSYLNTSGAFLIEPVAGRPAAMREAAEWQCTGQKMRSRAQVQNFRVAGLVALVAVAAAVILAGAFLEPGMALVRSRLGGGRRSGGRLRQFARATDGVYWLLHAGLRGSGAAAHPWQYGRGEEVGDEEVPMLGTPGVRFWPPVEGDGRLAPFYRCQPFAADPYEMTEDPAEDSNQLSPGGSDAAASLLMPTSEKIVRTQVYGVSS